MLTPASPPRLTTHQTMDDLQESRVTQLLASVSLLSSPEACYREKMYSGTQCQNKAKHIKADPMEPGSEEGKLQTSLAVLISSDTRALLLVKKV